MADNHQILKEAGLKVTVPRMKMLALLQSPDSQHNTAEDLYKRLLEQGDDLGLATVYRVLNHFEEVGILIRHHFEGGKSVFELTHTHHHDHLVCLDCGVVMEFSDDTIERRQKDIADRHGIELTHHSLYLYGYCQRRDECAKRQNKGS